MRDLYLKYREIINYLFFGACTTVVSLVVFYLFNKVFGLNEHVANVISWFFAVLFAYITNRKFVFESESGFLLKEIVSFYVSRLLTLGIEELVLFVGVSLFHADAFIVKLFAQVIVVVANYILSKLVVFRKR